MEKRARNSEYKPLLLTTTLRNPERIKVFLKVFAKYEGQILTNDVIHNIVFDLISSKSYVPNYVHSKKSLKHKLSLVDVNFSKEETEDIIVNSEQSHKEAGFDKGWPSRFDTWYKFLKELGFIYYKLGEKIRISDSGNRLIMANEEGYEHMETQVFLNAFVKYQRVNPYRKILNSNKPLILLLQVIRELKNRLGDKSAGVHINEIPLFICWKNDDYNSLTDEILEIRKSFGFKTSHEYIYDVCKRILGITAKDEKRFKISNITDEMPDEFIRKMRLTGIVTIRGMGQFIDINTLEQTKIDYILDNYVEQKQFTDEIEYFDYMKEIDSELLQSERVLVPTNEEKYNLFMKWVDYFDLSVICSELRILTMSKKMSNNEILKYINEPLRLEFLTALALQKKFPEIVVNPNFSIDDEGLPTSFAAGGLPDIVCKDKNGNILFEVTMIVGTQQCIREMNAITRHLLDCIKIEKDSFSVFLAPKIHEDTIRFAEYEKYKDNIDIITIDILGFISTMKSHSNIRAYRYK